MLNILEYSSARARMSVIARGPDGDIHLFCKGADARVRNFPIWLLDSGGMWDDDRTDADGDT